MSIRGETVQNMGSGLFADLGGPHTPGSNLLVYHLNQSNGTRNQNWRFTPVNAGKNLFVIQNVFTGGYASVESPEPDQNVKISLTSTPWEVTVVGYYSENFIIKLPNTSLVWGVTGDGKQDIKLVRQASNDQKQQWKITNAPMLVVIGSSESRRGIEEDGRH